MKKRILCLVMIIALLAVTGCGKNNKATEKDSKSNKRIVISDVDNDIRWEAITKYDITLEFEDGKCVSENYRLEFMKESNAIVYGIEMEGQPYVDDYKQEGNVVTYKRTGTNNEFYGRTYDEAYSIAKTLYYNATITKK